MDSSCFSLQDVVAGKIDLPVAVREVQADAYVRTGDFKDTDDTGPGSLAILHAARHRPNAVEVFDNSEKTLLADLDFSSTEYLFEPVLAHRTRSPSRGGSSHKNGEPSYECAEFFCLRDLLISVDRWTRRVIVCQDTALPSGETLVAGSHLMIACEPKTDFSSLTGVFDVPCWRIISTEGDGDETLHLQLVFIPLDFSLQCAPCRAVSRVQPLASLNYILSDTYTVKAVPYPVVRKTGRLALNDSECRGGVAVSTAPVRMRTTTVVVMTSPAGGVRHVRCMPPKAVDRLFTEEKNISAEVYRHACHLLALRLDIAEESRGGPPTITPAQLCTFSEGDSRLVKQESVSQEDYMFMASQIPVTASHGETTASPLTSTHDQLETRSVANGNVAELSVADPPPLPLHKTMPSNESDHLSTSGDQRKATSRRSCYFPVSLPSSNREKSQSPPTRRRNYSPVTLLTEKLQKPRSPPTERRAAPPHGQSAPTFLDGLLMARQGSALSSDAQQSVQPPNRSLSLRPRLQFSSNGKESKLVSEAKQKSKSFGRALGVAARKKVDISLPQRPQMPLPRSTSPEPGTKLTVKDLPPPIPAKLSGDQLRTSPSMLATQDVESSRQPVAVPSQHLTSGAAEAGPPTCDKPRSSRSRDFPNPHATANADEVTSFFHAQASTTVSLRHPERLDDAQPMKPVFASLRRVARSDAPRRWSENSNSGDFDDVSSWLQGRELPRNKSPFEPSSGSEEKNSEQQQEVVEEDEGKEDQEKKEKEAPRSQKSLDTPDTPEPYKVCAIWSFCGNQNPPRNATLQATSQSLTESKAFSPLTAPDTDVYSRAYATSDDEQANRPDTPEHRVPSPPPLPPRGKDASVERIVLKGTSEYLSPTESPPPSET